MRTNYRKIYKNFYGIIPIDENGITYEIHHIDGNRNNNNISNLTCVSIQEHYDIHYRQENWNACLAIAVRMNKTADEISNLSKMQSNQRVKDGTHHFLTGEIQRRSARKRIENETFHLLGSEHAIKRVRDGTHPFVGGEIVTETNLRRIKDGTHHFLTGEIQRKSNQKRLNDRTHHLLGDTNPSKLMIKCPHCNLVGGGVSAMTRWHFDNCKKK